MANRIIYDNGVGGVAIIIPIEECGLMVDQIAVKDVPAGEPYWIVDSAEIPVDRTNRDGWYIDMVEAGEPDGYGG
jgi:hypothetical protein